MKISATILSAMFLSHLLFAMTKTGAAEKIHSINPHKKDVHASKNHQASASLAMAIERQLSSIEKNIISTAEAMPEDKFYFTPEDMNLNGSEFKGVRTFAGQVKHLATDNFAIWTPLTGDPLRPDITDVNGPASIKTKEGILKYLKESFALGHKAIATLTDKNAMELVAFRGSNLPRLDLAFYALTHSNEHYGQMVVYLRMCGLIPPASLPAPK